MRSNPVHAVAGQGIDGIPVRWLEGLRGYGIVEPLLALLAGMR